MRTISLLLSLSLLLVAALVWADVPQQINYQGVLTDAADNPVASVTTGVQFTIYDSDIGGNSKWTETQNVTTDAYGRFSVSLGAVNPIPDSVFAEPTRWLGIAVGADPEMVPRAKLNSVSYSYRVSSIDGATGGRISGHLDLDTTSLFGGIILKDNIPFIHNFGVDNTYIGIYSGIANGDGARNTGGGFESLRTNNGGDDNTAFGAYALHDNTTGDYNTAVGANAIKANTIGRFNTAVGSGALSSNVDGLWNTAVGYLALAASTSANGNVAVGRGALRFNTTGASNAALGSYSMEDNSSGGTNTAVGYSSLKNNTTGNSNCVIGFQAASNNSSGTANTALGGNTLLSNTTGVQNTAVGYFADVASGNLSNATAIGHSATVDASNKIRLGNSSVTVIEGQVAYTFTSDEDQKENFHDLNEREILGKIQDMEIRSWNYIGHDPATQRHYGPTAQDFYRAFGDDGLGTVGNETTINSGDMAGILMAAVKALADDNDRLQSENDALRTRLEAIEQRLELLDKTY